MLLHSRRRETDEPASRHVWIQLVSVFVKCAILLPRDCKHSIENKRFRLIERKIQVMAADTAVQNTCNRCGARQRTAGQEGPRQGFHGE